jgi:predicted transcriptional regulator
MSELQEEILNLIAQDYKTCSDIAFELKHNQMHIGNSIKSLLNKKLIMVWYDSPNPPKYIKK